MINGSYDIIWCNYSADWWWNKSNLLHNYGDMFQSFTKWSILWIRILNHHYKWNRTASMVIWKITILDFEKAVFLLLKSVETSFFCFCGGIRTTKLWYKINWDTRIWILLLEIVVCGCLYIVLGISDSF